MSQISPPIRILLACAVAFIAAWMLFLKPKSPSAPSPAAATPAPNVQTGAPAKTGFGKAVQLAKGAVAKENAHAAQVTGGSAAATATAAAPATAQATSKASAQPPAPALPAAALKALPRDVAGALKARKVLVLGVIASKSTPWQPMADDDRAVRAALAKVNRYGGDVFVKRVALADIARYGPLFSSLQVNQTPSVVVVDRNLQGTTIAGYLDSVAIDQAIVDARRASTTRLISDPFLRRLNVACGRIGMLADRFPLPADRGERRTFAKRLYALASKRRRMFAGIAAPARWRPLKARLLHDMDGDVATARKLLVAAKAHNWNAFVDAVQTIDVGELKSLDRKLDSVGATACVADRRA